MNCSFHRYLNLIHGCVSVGSAGVWVGLINGIRGTPVTVDAVKVLCVGPVGAAHFLKE